MHLWKKTLIRIQLVFSENSVLLIYKKKRERERTLSGLNCDKSKHVTDIRDACSWWIFSFCYLKKENNGVCEIKGCFAQLPMTAPTVLFCFNVLLCFISFSVRFMLLPSVFNNTFSFGQKCALRTRSSTLVWFNVKNLVTYCFLHGMSLYLILTAQRIAQCFTAKWKQYNSCVVLYQTLIVLL